jgi:cation diffusion facilitator CzcD-associated flavoprotein CzcO
VVVAGWLVAAGADQEVQIGALVGLEHMVEVEPVTQVHSADYHNPQALPDGPVLVVGGGNSGFQIAEELAATRQVDLSIATT